MSHLIQHDIRFDIRCHIVSTSGVTSSLITAESVWPFISAHISFTLLMPVNTLLTYIRLFTLALSSSLTLLLSLSI